jgi:hypothetical protein
VELAQAERIESNHFASHWDTMPPVNVASAMVEGGRLRLRRPVSSLRADLGCFWSIETTSATRLRTLPDACATLSVVSGQGIALKCFLVGPRQTRPKERPQRGRHCSAYASNRALLLCLPAYRFIHLSSAAYD